jgi:hypothetical protein
LALRLSLLFALLDCSAEIGREHLIAALAVWQYAEDSARFIFGSASGDLLADRIAGNLKAAGGRMSRKEISDSLGRNYTSARLDEALKALLGVSRVEVIRQDTAGRPVEIWSLRGTN